MEYLETLKEISKENHVPIIRDSGLDFLIDFCKKNNPLKILEIGTAVGYSGSHMLLNTTNTTLVTIEKDEQSYLKAQKTFERLNLTNRVTQILGDAKDEIKKLNTEFDFVFLDGPKGQYLRYMEDLISLTKVGGYILADNVFLHGWVNGPEFVPHKHRAMVVNLRKFLDFIKTDKRLKSQVFDIGDGMALIKIINK